MLDEKDCVADSLRIAMLVVSSAVYLGYQLQPDARNALAHPLHEASERIERSEIRMPCKLAFWLAMVWKLLVTPDVGQKWHGSYLRKAIQELSLTSWEEAQKILRSMIWIEYLQDHNGRYAFEEVLHQTSSVDN